MSLTSIMDKTAKIERNSSPTVGAGGGVTENWTTVTASVACALMPRSGSSSREEFGYLVAADWRAYFPAGTDIQPQTTDGAQDRVTIDSVKYLCLYARDPGARGKLIIAYLRRLA